MPGAPRGGSPESYAGALTTVFLCAALVLVTGFVVALFMKEIPVSAPGGEKAGQDPEDLQALTGLSVHEDCGATTALTVVAPQIRRVHSRFGFASRR